jgi:hypothetical protein
MDSRLVKNMGSILALFREVVGRLRHKRKVIEPRSDLQLQLLAYMDSELPSREVRQMAQMVANDSRLRELLKELGNVKLAIAGNESERKVLLSRAFYWNKIDCAIVRQREEEVRRNEARSERIGWLAAAGSVVLGICIIPIWYPESQFSDQRPPGELEVALAEVGAIAFRDQRAGLTVVWHYNRNHDGADASVPPFSETQERVNLDPL